MLSTASNLWPTVGWEEKSGGGTKVLQRIWVLGFVAFELTGGDHVLNEGDHVTRIVGEVVRIDFAGRLEVQF